MNPDVRLSEHAVPACLVNLVRRVPPAPIGRKRRYLSLFQTSSDAARS